MGKAPLRFILYFSLYMVVSFTLVLGISTYMYFNKEYDPRLYDGYCPQLDRAMTDEEKIIAALEQSNKSIRISAKDKVTRKYFDEDLLMRYKDGREIYEKFPNCCFIEYNHRTDGKSRPATIDTSTERLRKEGRYAGHVIVKYEADYKAKDGTIRRAELSETLLLSNCGKHLSD